MNVMIIGSGGREHAVAYALKKSKRVDRVFVTPGNAGMTDVAETFLTNSFEDIYRNISDKQISLVFIGPEQPLQEGLSDYLSQRGVGVIGPSRRAAQLETSKVFAKSLMKRYKIPTADYRMFSKYEEAVSYLSRSSVPSFSFPLVIKADGLAAGKGVIIAEDREEALSALKKIMLDKDFGGAGDRVVIEEYLQGCEASIFAFTDGKDYRMTIISQDHKKAFDNDEGPNTGGMGAFAPVDISETVLTEIGTKVYDPLLKGLQAEGIEYKGIIYAGLIFTEKGVQVLEFNCRLGDPETQAVLPLLETDFVEICEAIVSNRINKLRLRWNNLSAVSIVAASEGYPEKYESSKLLDIDQSLRNDDSLRLNFSNVVFDKNNRLVTSGGRVLTLTALAATLPEARTKAYDNIEKIKFDNIYYRRDIAKPFTCSNSG